jgi:hypothetical protein
MGSGPAIPTSKWRLSTSRPNGRGARAGRRADRRLRARGPDAGGAAGRVPRHPHLHRRTEGRPVAAGPGRRHRLPHDGDVRGLRVQRAGAEGSVLDQRGDVLEARRAAARGHRPAWPRAGHRGRAVGVPARGAEPGPGARLLPGAHAPVAQPARAALRAPGAGLSVDAAPPTIPSPCAWSAAMPRMRARWRPCARATWSGATARAAPCARPSAASWWATRPTRPGA